MSDQTRLDRFDLPAEHFDTLDGYQAVWCIRPDGETSAWLMSPDRDADDRSRPPTPPHEQRGRLPVEFRDRLRGVVRCGALTRDGHPCRNEAQRCQWHQQDARP
jgi:hypothetical protein